MKLIVDLTLLSMNKSLIGSIVEITLCNLVGFINLVQITVLPSICNILVLYYNIHIKCIDTYYSLIYSE